MSNIVYPRGCDAAKVIPVIKTESARGSGKSSEDPVRIVTQYWSLEGELLAENDPIARPEGGQS